MPENPARRDGVPLRTEKFKGWILAATALVAVSTFLAAIPTDRWLLTLLWHGLTLAFAVGVAVLAFMKASAEDQEKLRLAEELEAERFKTLVTVNGSLQRGAKVIELLAAMSQDERERKVSEARGAMVGIACDLVRSTPMASYYRLDAIARPRRLMLEVADARERLDEPVPVLVEGDAEDADLWETVDGGDDLFEAIVPDGERHRFGAGGQRRYNTYIVAGVRAGVVPMGILVLTCPTAGDLADPDAAAMRVLARLLGTAEALGEGAEKMAARKAGLERTGPPAGPSE